MKDRGMDEGMDGGTTGRQGGHVAGVHRYDLIFQQVWGSFFYLFSNNHIPDYAKKVKNLRLILILFFI